MSPRSKPIWYLQSILNGYSQVFFSDQKVFAGILLLITFVDFYTGLSGFLSVVVTTTIARYIGFSKFRIHQGYYGFNSLLVGLGLGIHYQPGPLLLLIVILAAILTLFISISLEGVIGKYELPHLSLPFVFSLWAVMLASGEFQSLGLNERGIYTYNDLYILGGPALIRLYEWWGNLPLPPSLRAYLLSLGAIFFQFNMFTGLLVAIGLLLYSRIGFTLSLIGFYTAYLFYGLIGASFSEVSYSYIGFNYILSAIAIGGYFIIPNRSSYLWAMLLIPLVAILTISLSNVMWVFKLPIYSLPFNIMALLFLYVLKFRMHNRINLSTLFVQQNSPEKNLYSFLNYMQRFGQESAVPIYLPFFGQWAVTQGHSGEYTHKDEWRHAWDFEIKDEQGKTFRNEGDYPADYYCYDKTIIAPADGQIEMIKDDIDDNIIGQKDLNNNWGNTIVIKHSDDLFTKLSHLKKGTLQVKEGDKVKKGDALAKCGNSGNSPFPHLHFQVQETPYIGSKTLDYPISNYLLQNDKTSLKTVAIPQKDEVVSNIQANPSLRKAFHFIPGELINMEVAESPEYSSVWEVKQDEYLNRYIECGQSHCKAWFKNDDAMLFFTHFSGKKDNLLYYFYLGAFKVCLGDFKDMDLRDVYPLNQVFNQRQLFLQDFMAPFYRYMKAEYLLEYNILKETLSETDMLLKASTYTIVSGRKSRVAQMQFLTGNNGLEQFQVTTSHKNIKAICTKGHSLS